MLERRAPRFAVEVLVLVALAVSLTIAHLDRLVIAGVMLLGWLIVSVLEWASLRGEAHYGSGLPPRYYVPQVLLPPPLTLEESVERYQAAPPVEEPAWVVSPAFEEDALVGGWPVSAPAPGEEAASLEPAAFVGGTEQAWEPVQPAADDVAAQIEPEWTPELEPPEELELESEPSGETEPELEPEWAPEPEWEWEAEEAHDAAELRPAVSDVTEYEALPVEEAADESWFVEGLPGVPTAEEELEDEVAPTPEFVPEPEAELAAPAREELEPVAEVELAEPALEEEPVAEPPEPPPVISAGWFDAQLPGVSAPVEPEPELEPELVEEPVLELPEPVVEEPVAELELPQPDLAIEPELEEEPVESLAELPLSATWFDSPLPGVSAPVEPEPAFEPELVEEPVLELPEPVVEEPVAELELPQPELEIEPELEEEPVLELLPELPVSASWFDVERLAGEPLGKDASLVSWFDAQLPGVTVVSEAESSGDEALVGRAQHQEHGVGGWVAGHVPEGWRVSDRPAGGRPGDEGDLVWDEVWERNIAAEEDLALMEAALQGPDVTARYSIDPLVGVAASRSRLWGRQYGEDEAEDAVTVEVPARPVGRRLLPGRSKREN